MAFTFTLNKKNVKRHRVNINQKRERIPFYACCDIVNRGKLKMKLRKIFLWRPVRRTF